ncbi:unnamed protein product [Prunus armeniaca]
MPMMTKIYQIRLGVILSLVGYEASFINNIIDRILSQLLRRTYWNVAKHPVGIQSHVQDVKKLLDVGGNGRRMQLDNLAGVGWFGEGSRVIITTQDRGLLKRHGINSTYEVQKLYGNRALELFSLNAFETNKPPKDYLGLAQRAVEYAQGIPLALTLLGSHLRYEDKDCWQNILDSYEGEPYTGEKKDYVLQIVSNSKNNVSRDCIEVLIEKAMITIDYGRIQMHDLLEKLGKDIVHEESSNDLGKQQVLPPRVTLVLLDNCTSLEKIPKLAWVLLDNCTSLEKIPEFPSVDDSWSASLTNCVRLRGYDITENIFLNHVSVSSPHSSFDINLPGDEVPNFEIPPNLKWEMLRLVLCVVSMAPARILLNGKLVNAIDIGMLESHEGLLEGHVIFHLSGNVPTYVKIPCGVHLLGHQVADISETDVVDHGPTQLLLPDAMAVDDDIRPV